MTLKRMDNVGIVVESLDEAIAFFAELGLKLEGRAMIEGEWAGRVTGLGTPARRDRHDGHPRRPQPARALAISHPACSRRSSERPGERSRLPTRHVRRGRHRRDARQAPQARRAARRRSGPVRGRVSALLHPRPRRTSHRARRAARVKRSRIGAETALALRQASCRLETSIHWRITTGCSGQPAARPAAEPER